MAGKQGVSGTGVGALAVGSLLFWSSLKGKAWTKTLRELIAGNQPSDSQDYPITSQLSEIPGTSPTVPGAGGWDTAHASSFWGLQTASGNPMTADTIASPYIPLGSTVIIQKDGKTVSGTVQDFGPADWVMKLDPTRFLDLAEPMMEKLTGHKNGLAQVQYQVTKWNSNGRIYRPNAAMALKLKKRWTNG